MESLAVLIRISTTRAFSEPCNTSPELESATKSFSRLSGRELTCQRTPTSQNTLSKQFRMRSPFRMVTMRVTVIQLGRISRLDLITFLARLHLTPDLRLLLLPLTIHRQLTLHPRLIHRNIIRRLRPFRHRSIRPAHSHQPILIKAHSRHRDRLHDQIKNKFSSQRRAHLAESIDTLRNRHLRLSPVVDLRRLRHQLRQVPAKTTSFMDCSHLRRETSSASRRQHRQVRRSFTSLHHHRRRFTSLHRIRHTSRAQRIRRTFRFPIIRRMFKSRLRSHRRFSIQLRPTCRRRKNNHLDRSHRQQRFKDLHIRFIRLQIAIQLTSIAFQ